MTNAILSIDQGTTNSKVILLTQDGRIIASGSAPVKSVYPEPGWVEQDPIQIWQSQLLAIKKCVEGKSHYQITHIGISNQRESIVCWDRDTGQPLSPVISWQCRRTSDICKALKKNELQQYVLKKTGLPIDPLFPATKIAWIISRLSEKQLANACIGTIDSWLIWNLSGGKAHKTDMSNASRTQLFNLETLTWDKNLLEFFNVPLEILPTVHDSAHLFASTTSGLPIAENIPITSAIGDSHAALFGHRAFNVGDGKITFGTGSSIMLLVDKFISPPAGLTTTIAWSLENKATYALEGNILSSASILPWTAEILGLKNVQELIDLAESVNNSAGVTIIPALVGLGAPHWSAQARGLIDGLTFNNNQAHIARASLESMALSVKDVIAIIEKHCSENINHFSVDGGPTRNLALMDLVATYLQHTLKIDKVAEASATGAGFLAGLHGKVWPNLMAIENLPKTLQTIRPKKLSESDKKTMQQWQRSIQRVLLNI